MPSGILQCCQGADISPQNTKGVEKNYVGPGKFAAEFFADLSKMGPKRGRTFLGLNFS
jgi:hypothetical protein